MTHLLACMSSVGCAPRTTTATSMTGSNLPHIRTKCCTSVLMHPDTSPKTSYDLSLSASRGPPIPEAGFSMTSLTPAVLQAPENSGSQVQNQNFVLVGGHTQQAFINMSQVALFSLPEESWTFVPIDDPDPPPKTDLATRASPIVEPRSGHTAVLIV